jgi:hypothetical protein
VWTSRAASLEAGREYIEGANASFPGGWGDDRLFQWAFLDPRADRTGMVIEARQGDAMVAGSGLTFRTIDNGRGLFLAAIMTGSWTRPEARGLGLFGAMIQQSAALAQAAGAQLLLAFVTQSNASRRRLEAAGAVLFPSAYCQGPLDVPTVTPPLRQIDRWPRTRLRSGAATFAYSDEEWARQFLHRPTATDVRILGDDTVAAVVECTERSLVVHALSAPDEARALSTLAAWAATQQRRLFCFTTSVALHEELARRGFAITPGSVAAIATGEQPVDALVHEWDLVNGDRL